MKAIYTLRENIRALLAAQHKQQKDLAFSVGRGASWINKFLNGTREIQFGDLDKIADFFHLTPYQLFIPGIAAESERRSGKDRRSGIERRVPDEVKTMIKLRSHLSSPGGSLHASQSSHDGQQRQQERLVDTIAQRFAHELVTAISQTPNPGGQAAAPRGTGDKTANGQNVPDRDRKGRRRTSSGAS